MTCCFQECWASRWKSCYPGTPLARLDPSALCQIMSALLSPRMRYYQQLQSANRREANQQIPNHHQLICKIYMSFYDIFKFVQMWYLWLLHESTEDPSIWANLLNCPSLSILIIKWNVLILKKNLHEFWVACGCVVMMSIFRVILPVMTNLTEHTTLTTINL